MNIGPLDRRITFEYPSVTADEYGAPVTTWKTLATVWANVQDVLPSRSEAVTQQVLSQSKNQTRIRFRYRADVNSAMRIVLRGATDRVFNIVGGPAEIGRHEYMEIMCEVYAT